MDAFPIPYKLTVAAVRILCKLTLLLAVTRYSIAFEFFPRDEFVGVPIRMENILDEENSLQNENVERSLISLVESPVCQFKEEEGEFVITEGSTCTIDEFIHAKYPVNDPFCEITKIFNGEHFQVDSYSIDTKSKNITVEASSKGSFKLFQFLVVGSVDFPTLLTFTFSTVQRMLLQNMDMQLAGRSSIEVDKQLSYEVIVTIYKLSGHSKFVIDKMDFTASEIDVSLLLSRIGAPVLPGSKYGLKQGKIKSEVSGLKGTGAFVNDEEYQLILMTNDTILGSSKTTNGMTSFVVTKRFESKPTVAITVSYPSKAEIHNEINPLLTTKCISTFPLTDLEVRATPNWCLVISGVCTKFMNVPAITEATQACHPVGDASMKKGIHVILQVKIKKALKMCGAKEDALTLLPDTTTLVGEVRYEGGMDFSLADNLETPLQATITCFSTIPNIISAESRYGIPNSNNIRKAEIDFSKFLPEFLKGGDGKPQAMKIEEAQVDPETGAMNLAFTLTLPDSYNTIPFTDISFSPIACKMKKSKDDVWDFSGKGSVKVGEAQFDVSITKEKETYTLEVTCPNIRLSDILSIFKDLKEDKGKFQGTALSDIGMKDFALLWILGDKTFINIKGTLVLPDYEGISVQGMYWNPEDAGKGGQPADAFAIGIYFDGFDFDWLVEKIMGERAFSISWLSDLKALVAISNANAKVSGGGKKSKRSHIRRYLRSTEETEEESISTKEAEEESTTTKETEDETDTFEGAETQNKYRASKSIPDAKAAPEVHSIYSRAYIPHPPNFYVRRNRETRAVNAGAVNAGAVNAGAVNAGAVNAGAVNAGAIAGGSKKRARTANRNMKYVKNARARRLYTSPLNLNNSLQQPVKGRYDKDTIPQYVSMKHRSVQHARSISPRYVRNKGQQEDLEINGYNILNARKDKSNTFTKVIVLDNKDQSATSEPSTSSVQNFTTPPTSESTTRSNGNDSEYDYLKASSDDVLSVTPQGPNDAPGNKSSKSKEKQTYRLHTDDNDDSEVRLEATAAPILDNYIEPDAAPMQSNYSWPSPATVQSNYIVVDPAPVQSNYNAVDRHRVRSGNNEVKAASVTAHMSGKYRNADNHVSESDGDARFGDTSAVKSDSTYTQKKYKEVNSVLTEGDNTASKTIPDSSPSQANYGSANPQRIEGDTSTNSLDTGNIPQEIHSHHGISGKHRIKSDDTAVKLKPDAADLREDNNDSDKYRAGSGGDAIGLDSDSAPLRINYNSPYNHIKRGTPKKKAPALKFDIAGFDSIQIKPGVSFGLLWTLPSDEGKCLKNSLCIWMSKHFKNFKVVISGYVDANFNLELSAEFQLNVDITESLTFNYFKLLIVTSLAELRVELQCKMTYTNADVANKPLEFTGSLFTDGKSLQLSFSMNGFVVPPKWPYFSIGDVQLNIGYSPGAAPIPKLGFGMTLMLGKIDVNSDNSDAVRFEGRFEIDPNNPQENWIFVKVNALSIGAFCKAYQLNCESVPSKIQESGFPEGLELSFSTKKRKVAVAKREIPAGLQICGTINILGLSAYANIKIETGGNSWGFEIEIILPLLNWAGGTVIVARDAKAKEGPRGWVKLGGGKFGLSIEGYAQFLLISAGVKIKIDGNNIEFQIEGPLVPGLLQARLNVKGKFESLSSFDVSFTAEVFTSEFGAKMKEYMVKFLQEAADRAKAAMAKVQESLNDALATLDSAKADVQRWKDKIENWKKEITARKEKYEAKAGGGSDDCKAQCPKVCQKGATWDKCCHKVFGKCCGCGKIDKCKKMGRDIKCMGKCTMKKAASSVQAFFLTKLEAAKMVLANIGEGFGFIAEGVIDLAERVVELAKQAAEFAGKALEAALKAGIQLLEKAGNILEIEKLLLSGKLDSNYCGTLEYDIKLKVFDKPIQSSGKLSVNDVLKSLYNMITRKDESGLQGISETEDKVNEINGMTEASDDSLKHLKKQREDAAEEMQVKQKSVDEVNGEGEGSRRSSIAFSPAEQLYIKKHYYKNNNTPHSSTLSTFLDRPMTYPSRKLNYIKSGIDPIFLNAPWNVMDKYDPLKDGITNIRNAEVLRKRMGKVKGPALGFEEVKSPCQRMKKALVLYRDMANALSATSGHIQDGYSTLSDRKALHKENLEDVRRDILHSANRYNMSTQDMDRSYYFYTKLADGYKQLDKKSSATLAKCDSYAIPLYRKQLENILKRDTGKTFLEYSKVVDENAVKGYKRSFVSTTPRHEKGLQLLKRIKKSLIGVVTNDEKPLSSFVGTVENLNRDIRKMSTDYERRCRS